MNKQLLKDLAELEARQVITAETAAKIKNYYQQEQPASVNKLAIILGILGALLIGSGLILIIAHNWDNLSKLMKTIVGLMPLLAAQLLSSYTLWKRRESRGWRESSAVLLFLAIPATISVISQIYQTGGELKDFLLTWTLLALPIVYILSSSVVAMLCVVIATWYAALTGYFDRPTERPYMYLVMMLSLAPYYYKLFRMNPASNLMLLFHFILCFSATIVLGSFIQVNDDWYAWFFAVYLMLFCIFYYTGSLLQLKENRVNTLPFHATGIAGILVILFTWSFNFLWEGLRDGQLRNAFFTPLPYLLVAGIIIVSLMIRKSRIEKQDWNRHLIGLSFIMFLASTLIFFKIPEIGILIINLWILLVALVYIRKGSRDNHFGILNFGLMILGILALCRFFDDSIPFVWRGVFFLLTGIAFFVSNYMLLNRRKALHKS